MTIESPILPDSSRRRFLTVAAVTSAVAAGSLAVAAMPPQDDRRLLELEELIFEQHWAAHAYDDEIVRLSEIWRAEGERLYHEGRLSPDERWNLVWTMPEAKEHDRLVKLQDEPFGRRDDLMEEMFATPAHTPEGRRAKVLTLLVCVLGDDWANCDELTAPPYLTARNLLIEFIGGKPGEQLRNQFT